MPDNTVASLLTQISDAFYMGLVFCDNSVTHSVDEDEELNGLSEEMQRGLIALALLRKMLEEK